MPSRNESLRAAFDAAAIPGMGFEGFKHKLTDWSVYPVMVCGNLAGAILHKGPEIHACILPEYRSRWFSRAIITDVLDPIIGIYGIATTAVPDTKPWGRDFVERLGFIAKRHENGATFYEMKRCKYGH